MTKPTTLPITGASGFATAEPAIMLPTRLPVRAGSDKYSLVVSAMVLETTGDSLACRFEDAQSSPVNKAA